MSELLEYFKAHDIGAKEIAKRTGYSLGYIRNLLNGSDELSNSARYRFMRAFPEAAPLVASGNGNASPAPAGAT